MKNKSKSTKVHSIIAGIALAVLVCGGCGPTKPKDDSAATDVQSKTEQQKTSNADASEHVENNTATMAEVAEVRDLLTAMAEAYRKASSYQDVGEVVLKGSVNGKQFSEKRNYMLSLERPNKLRMHVYQGTAVCDGNNLLAWVAEIPNQVLKIAAPAEVDIATIFADNVLAESMANGPTQRFAWVPLQMLLLSADDPLNTLLFEAKETRLLEPTEIEGNKCLKVQVRRSDGTCVFWIDEKNKILRRFEFPVEQMSGVMGGNKIEITSLTADFHAAKFDEPVDPKAFETQLPPGAELADEFVPMNVQMLGKKLSDFILVGLDNKPLTLNSLSGKTALIELWSVSCMPCREILPQIEEIYRKFKDDPKMAFLALNIDPPNVTNQQLQKTFDDLGVSLPIYRDEQKAAGRVFKLQGIPTTVILGPDGRVQGYQPGLIPDAAAVINLELQRLLAGKDLAAETLHTFETLKLRYAEIFQAMVSQNLYVNPAIIVSRMSVAQKTQPKSLKLKPLWKQPRLKNISSILVVPPDDKSTAGVNGGPKIFVANGGRAVAELDASGKIAAEHDLQIPQQEYVTRLRTFKGKDGRRLYLGLTPGMQQVHLFDENWRRILSFPEDADKNQHAGVGDACIADTNGDGTGEIAVGYLGLVGVKSIALNGTQRWSNRSIANVFSMALGEPDQSGRRLLYCVNDRTALAALDPDGKMQRELSLDGRLLFAIAAAELDGDAQAELCGLSAPGLGENLAVGLNTQGDLLWSYQMPKGTFAETVQRICGARLKKSAPGQWVLLGPDGSVHIVGIDGKPVDQFNYGDIVTGLASADIEGRGVLLFGSRQGVEAVAVEDVEH